MGGILAQIPFLSHPQNARKCLNRKTKHKHSIQSEIQGQRCNFLSPTSRQKERKHFDEKLKKMTTALRATRQPHKVVKSLRREYKSKSIFCKNKNGVIIVNKNEAYERWVFYFKELLNPSQTTHSADLIRNMVLYNRNIEPLTF